jgi:hypothetical protein
MAAPVDECRIERVPEVVERRVRDEEHPVEEERQRQRAAEEVDDLTVTPSASKSATIGPRRRNRTG